MEAISNQTSILQILKGKNGTYTLQPEPINNGAISQVFLGQNNRTHKQVAIKEVLQETFRGKKQNLYFEQELKISKYLMEYGSLLKHVVRIYDVVESEDYKSFYIIMEYLEEGDFSCFIDNFKDSRVSTYLPTVALHIAKGIQELHELNIVHRDIKPQNIFVKKRDFYSFKVGDFGLCKIVPKKTNSANTSKSSIVGTISYMAPEQFSSYYDISVDVWSFGCLLYEASRGTQLFKQNYGSSYNDILRMIQAFRRFNCKDSNDFIGQIISRCLVPAEDRPEIGAIVNNIKQKISKDEQNGLTKTQLICANQSIYNSMISTSFSTFKSEGANTTMQQQQQTLNHFQEDGIIFNETQIYVFFPKEAHLEQSLNQTLNENESSFIQNNFDNSTTLYKQRVLLNTATLTSDSAKRPLDQNALHNTMNMSIRLTEESNSEQINLLEQVLSKARNYSEAIKQIYLYRTVFPIFSKKLFYRIKDSQDDENQLQITDLFPLKSSNQVLKTINDNPRARRIWSMFVYDRHMFKDGSFVFYREFFKDNSRCLEYHLFIQALVNIIYQKEHAESCLIYLLNIASKEVAGNGGTYETRYPRLCTLFLLILHKLDINFFSTEISQPKRTEKVIECLKQALLFNGLNSEISSFAQKQFPLKKGTDFLGQKFLKIDPRNLYSMNELEKYIAQETSNALTIIVYCLEGNQGKIFLSKKQSDVIFPLHISTVIVQSASSSIFQQFKKTHSENPLDYRNTR